MSLGFDASHLDAGRGHLEVLKWCRANGCPWDEDIRREAAKGGHLEVLKWCRANGCPRRETNRGL